MAIEKSHPGEDVNLVCPKCRAKGMRRVRRQGWIERTLLPQVGYYPWECIDCREISLLHMRKSAREAHTTTTRATE